MSELPCVLLLGDSIRMSYQPYVSELLAGRARVVGPDDNCQYSLYTLSSLDRWLAALGNPDVVHWNNGLHDCGHNPSRSPVQIPLDMYRANLEHVLRRLRAATSRIIWATTTPVHPDRPFRTDQWSWRNAEIDAYNAAGLEMSQEHGLPVNDLHGLVWANVNAFLSEDQLHLSPAGQRACAAQVAQAAARHL